jgi:5-methylcytosine-specific restriction endonuclease McrA|tara:strand:+ start:1821 stop:2108 length:288 start_codon:yes stop_codon:yes gene_type:complete
MNREEERRKNIARKQARRDAVKSGKVSTGDGKDLDHKKPLSKGGSNKPSNTKAVSVSKNRSEGGAMGGKAGSSAAKKRAGAMGGKASTRKGTPNK